MKKTNTQKNQKKEKKIFSIQKGIEILKKSKKRKFIESIDAAFNLNINPKKPEQNIRNTAILPHGTGKNIKIAVFTTGKNIKIAYSQGADTVGMEDLAEIIKKKKQKFDIIIATPETMQLVGTLGPILGPRGLMPNPKFGTVTQNIKSTIQEIKSGKIHYKNDKNGIIHSTFGKINFSNQELFENFLSLYNAIKKSRPPLSKGLFFKKISVSSTMGPGIIINHLLL